MITIETNQYKDILRDCFSKDEELITTWHINAGLGLESCIDRTNNDLLSINDLKFYGIKDNDNLVGFYATEVDMFLTTFFVMPECRNKEKMKEIWHIMIKDMPNKFYSGLYSKNTRAIEFLKKNGGKSRSFNGVEFFEFNKEELCL